MIFPQYRHARVDVKSNPVWTVVSCGSRLSVIADLS